MYTAIKISLIMKRKIFCGWVNLSLIFFFVRDNVYLNEIMKRENAFACVKEKSQIVWIPSLMSKCEIKAIFLILKFILMLLTRAIKP